LAAAEFSAKDLLLRRSGREMWYGFRQVRSAGMELPPSTALTHIAIQEKLDGKVVDRMEQVSDEQFKK
jgi:hypothetical protein